MPTAQDPGSVPVPQNGLKMDAGEWGVNALAGGFTGPAPAPLARYLPHVSVGPKCTVPTSHYGV